MNAQNIYILRTYVLCSYIEEEEREEEEWRAIKIMREMKEREMKFWGEYGSRIRRNWRGNDWYIWSEYITYR